VVLVHPDDEVLELLVEEVEVLELLLVTEEVVVPDDPPVPNVLQPPVPHWPWPPPQAPSEAIRAAPGTAVSRTLAKSPRCRESMSKTSWDLTAHGGRTCALLSRPSCAGAGISTFFPPPAV
jgi:hypothetical protein